MPPVIAPRVSLSPPMEMTLRIASSNDSDSKNAMIPCSTVSGQVAMITRGVLSYCIKWSKNFDNLDSL